MIRHHPPAHCLTFRAFRSGIARCVVGLVLLAWPPPAAAQKTDSVWIRNGDRITGEVKSLARALLKYSTDDLGTIYIEWDNVARISSRQTFEVQVTSGQKFYGSLGQAPNGRMIVGVDTLRLAEVVVMAPIRQTFVARLDGYLDLGFSFQKANRTLQLTSGFKVVYRSTRVESAIEASTFREDREDAAETARLTSDFTQRFLLGDRWSLGLGAGYERNEELDLAGRFAVLAFGAWTFRRSNHDNFWMTGGPVVTREEYFSADSTSHGIEALIGAMYRAFRYDRPKLDAAITSQLYPSVTIPGRVRWQNDLRVSYELVADFMVTMTLFDSFDNKPQATGASKNDFGTTLAISWTF
jgi:hypothetical protein